MQRQTVEGLQIAKVLYDFVNEEALPGTGVEPQAFWAGFAALVRDLAPRNRALLDRREALETEIDRWHRDNKTKPFDPAAYAGLLERIGYIGPDPAPFSVATANVDPEIAEIAGPQLVVPVTNARYALNAANARWGSLYDALYGTDVIPDSEGAARGPGYNPVRGARVIAWARALLDRVAPLEHGSHADATLYAIRAGELVVTLAGGKTTGLVQPEKFVALKGETVAPSAVLLRNHGLHIEIRIDRTHPIGETDTAGIADLIVEAAITTIMDCEDSISAVDADDKTLAYRNWLGLMKADLSASFDKGGRNVLRRMEQDRVYTKKAGGELVLQGRSLMLVRNVGHHMYTDAVPRKFRPVPGRLAVPGPKPGAAARAPGCRAE